MLRRDWVLLAIVLAIFAIGLIGALVSWILNNFGSFVWIVAAIAAFVISLRSSSSEGLKVASIFVLIIGVVGLFFLFDNNGFTQEMLAAFGATEGVEDFSSTLWDHTFWLKAYYFVLTPISLGAFREP